MRTERRRREGKTAALARGWKGLAGARFRTGAPRDTCRAREALLAVPSRAWRRGAADLLPYRKKASGSVEPVPGRATGGLQGGRKLSCWARKKSLRCFSLLFSKRKKKNKAPFYFEFGRESKDLETKLRYGFLEILCKAKIFSLGLKILR